MAVELKRYPFTVSEYDHLFEAGVLDGRARVKLIDGELIEMPPIGPQHLSRHILITRYLVRTLDDRATVAPMGSFPLGTLMSRNPISQSSHTIERRMRSSLSRRRIGLSHLSRLRHHRFLMTPELK